MFARILVRSRVVLIPAISLALVGLLHGAVPGVSSEAAIGVGAAWADDGAAPGVAHVTLPTIAVLSVGDLDTGGRSHVVATGQGDALVYLDGREAIGQSHAFRLLSRDQMTQQVKEIKTDSEGWVDPATALQFGKSAAIQKFLTVFISTSSVQRLHDPNATTFNYPVTGSVVPARSPASPTRSAAVPPAPSSIVRECRWRRW